MRGGLLPIDDINARPLTPTTKTRQATESWNAVVMKVLMKLKMLYVLAMTNWPKLLVLPV